MCDVCEKRSRTLRRGGDEMRNLRCTDQMKPVNRLLHNAIGVGDALVLAQMLHPGFDQERLDNAALPRRRPRTRPRR